MAQMINEKTPIYYWNAIDRTYDQDQNVIMQDEKRRMYVQDMAQNFKS